MRLFMAMLVSVSGCAAGSGLDDSGGPGGNLGKGDSGWLSDETFEVNVRVTSRVTTAAAGDWADVATNAETQARLVDTQLKFTKNQLIEQGYLVSQLSETVQITGVTSADGKVTLDYQAVTDMVRAYEGTAPQTLAELPALQYRVALPADPVDMLGQAAQRCADNDEAEGDVKEYNYYYYFAPTEEGCDVTTVQATVDITDIFPPTAAYPEYDRLADDMGDGKVGFRVALMPDVDDDGGLLYFNDNARVLERDLGLTGVRSEDQTYVRYTWDQEGTRVIIDQFDPTKAGWFEDSFRNALRSYHVVAYGGHSVYGTLDYLTAPESYSSGYQIVLMESCRSYEYYSRRVARAKSWANADFLGTTGSPSVSSGGPTVRELVRGLQSGLVAAHNGRRAQATSWLAIARAINETGDSGADVGLAGVRANRWKP